MFEILEQTTNLRKPDVIFN